MLAQIGTGSFFRGGATGNRRMPADGLTLMTNGGAWPCRFLVFMPMARRFAGSVLCEQIESGSQQVDGIVIFAATATPADFATWYDLFDAFDVGDGLARHVVRPRR